MVDVRQMVGARPTGRRPQQVVSGIVSLEQPPPGSFTDPLYVTVPSHSSEVLLTFDSWPRLHGTALPKSGAKVQIAYDELSRPQVTWWDAPTGSPPPLPVAEGGTGSASAAGARGSLGAVGKYSTVIGDGASLTFTVTHNLGTTAVIVQVFDMATGILESGSDFGIEITDANTVIVAFASPPAVAGGSMPGGTGKQIVVTG